MQILPKLKISYANYISWLAMISESKDMFQISKDYELNNLNKNNTYEFDSTRSRGGLEVSDEIRRFKKGYEFNYRNIPMVLSFFDTRRGPRILLAESEAMNALSRVTKHEDFLTSLMDIHQTDDFFIHHFEGIMSINYCFSVNDENARGGIQLFMLSLIVDSVENQVEVLKRVQFFNHYLKYLAKRMNRSVLIKKIYNEYNENMRLMNGKGSTNQLRGINSEIEDLNAVKSTLDSNIASETLRSLFKN